MSTREIVLGILIPFASTFCGVFTAYWLALKRERKRRRGEENETRTHLRKSLHEELSKLLENVQTAIDLTNTGEIGPIPHIDFYSDAKASGVNSGAFSLLEPTLRSQVSHVYAVVERAQFYFEMLVDFTKDSAFALTVPSIQKFKPFHQGFMSQLHNLCEHIPSVLDKLDDGAAAEEV